MPRTKGARGKRTIAVETNVAWWDKNGGMTPLEHILCVQHGKIPGPSAGENHADMYRAAVDACPFVHARLSATKVDAKLEGEINVKHQTEAVRLIETAMDTIKPVNGHADDAV